MSSSISNCSFVTLDSFKLLAFFANYKVVKFGGKKLIQNRNFFNLTNPFMVPFCVPFLEQQRFAVL